MTQGIVMQKPDVTVFVCVSCRSREETSKNPGEVLLEALNATLSDHAGATVCVKAVECLSVCNRPCTIALAAPGKWTYVIGDLNPVFHVDDIVTSVRDFASSEDGIVPWKQRPLSFRKGTVSRIPPIEPS